MHNDLIDTVLVVSDKKTAAPGRGSETKTAISTGPSNNNATTTTNMQDRRPDNASEGEQKCPVDHKTRELWLEQARQQRAAQPAAESPTTPSLPSIPQPSTSAPPSPPSASSPSSSSSSSSSWSSWIRWPFSSQAQPPPPAAPPVRPLLDETRVISSIPRSSAPGPSACPANDEQETGASSTGHWVYPSERQFFEAMRRKGHTSAAAADMKTVVPIHNAVNERAWAEILEWERPYSGDKGGCPGGPRLHSFAGLGAQKLSPRARMNTLLGYSAPFDRHDWVVDRCGTRVEYVIDFYAGRNDGAGRGKLNFYLDVRPKLNSWEGVKMRALRVLGLS
ncbi:hypothetical protein VTJ83DRAFT_21 [Remersonia thermophila]|uniref:Holocytochrome c-type synthase n=1 Tax=Remersonia thermophila TaxID=72144 RepID=A0ABR4DJU5_9PEZI